MAIKTFYPIYVTKYAGFSRIFRSFHQRLSFVGRLLNLLKYCFKNSKKPYI